MATDISIQDKYNDIKNKASFLLEVATIALAVEDVDSLSNTDVGMGYFIYARELQDELSDFSECLSIEMKK